MNINIIIKTNLIFQCVLRLLCKHHIIVLFYIKVIKITDGTNGTHLGCHA